MCLCFCVRYQIREPVKNHIMYQTSVNFMPYCIKHTSRSFWYEGTKARYVYQGSHIKHTFSSMFQHLVFISLLFTLQLSVSCLLKLICHVISVTYVQFLSIANIFCMENRNKYFCDYFILVGCRSVGPSVGWLVGRSVSGSVGRSVGWSVGRFYHL